MIQDCLALIWNLHHDVQSASKCSWKKKNIYLLSFFPFLPKISDKAIIISIHICKKVFSVKIFCQFIFSYFVIKIKCLSGLPHSVLWLYFCLWLCHFWNVGEEEELTSPIAVLYPHPIFWAAWWVSGRNTRKPTEMENWWRKDCSSIRLPFGWACLKFVYCLLPCGMSTPILSSFCCFCLKWSY